MADETINKVVNGIKKFLKNEKEERWYSYLFAIIANLIFLYIVNNLLYWNLSFIADSFSSVLWAINLSLIVALVANVSFILYDQAWYKHTAKIIMGFTTLIASYILLTVFPFNLTQNIVIICFIIILVLSIIASIVSILIEIVKLLYTIIES